MDPEALVDWDIAQPRGVQDDQALVAAALALADTRPDRAAAMAQLCTDASQRRSTLAHVMRCWAAQDATGSAAWLRHLSSDPDVLPAWEAWAVSVAGRDPALATRVAVAEIPPGPERDRAVVSILQRWAQHAPEEAAAWLEQFPECPLRTAALGAFLPVWLAQDPPGLEAWLAHLPAGSFSAEAAALIPELPLPALPNPQPEEAAEE